MVYLLTKIIQWRKTRYLAETKLTFIIIFKMFFLKLGPRDVFTRDLDRQLAKLGKYM